MQKATVLEKISESVGELPPTVVCVDIEATCWESDAPGDLRTHEVIEIGMVAINTRALEITREISILIQPVENPVLSDFCVQLTSITNDLLVNSSLDDPAAPYETIRADAFGQAMQIAREWLAPFGQYVWCSWGNYDLRQMEAEAARKGTELALPASLHFNAKMIYAKTRSGVKRRGLGAAVKRQNLSFSGTQHRGVDDARNVARVILSDQGVVFAGPTKDQ